MTHVNLSFVCEGNHLIGSLDRAGGTAGLLLVSGGNELRCGAWSGQALLASRLAGAGFPTLRFDRRGVGDSEGGNGGFLTSGPDIVAALAAFKAACPGLTRVVGFGNCDAASALMLNRGSGCDALVLANPWTIEREEEAPPPEALRAHYRSRLASPDAIRRLITGKVSLGSLLGSLRAALSPAPPPSSLAQDMATGIGTFAGPVTVLLAERDRTAQAFAAAWAKGDPRIRRCPQASHSFVEPEAREWLFGQVLEALRA